MIKNTLTSEYKELEKMGYGMLLFLLQKVNPIEFDKHPEYQNSIENFFENYEIRYMKSSMYIKEHMPISSERFNSFYEKDKRRKTKFAYYDNYTLKDYIEKLGVWGENQQVLSSDGTAFKKFKAQFQIFQEMNPITQIKGVVH